MNRATIIESFQHFSGLDVLNVNSISHDSIFIENDIQGNTCVIQRNGVQRVGINTNFILPGALGTEAYIFKSNGNQDSYYSANHGVGRILDKKEARGAFSDEDTLKDLKISNLKIIKIGQGSISEQNNKSFKSVKGVVDEMVRLNLGQTIAMTKPIVSVKS